MSIRERVAMGHDGPNAAEVLYNTFDENGARALPEPTGAALKAETIDKIDAKISEIDEHLADTSLELGETLSEKIAEVDGKLDEADAKIEATEQVRAQTDLVREQAAAVVAGANTIVANVPLSQEAREGAELARDQAKLSAANELARIGFVAADGFEADLSGVATAAVTATGNAIELYGMDGIRRFLSPVAFEGSATGGALSLSSLTVAGISEQTLIGFEADLAGVTAANVDADGRLIVDFTPPPVIPPSEVLVTGFEQDLLGKSIVFLGADETVLAEALPAETKPPVASLSTSIAIFGHSIGAAGSGIGPTLAGLFPSRAFFFNSIGGQRTSQIARRQGGKPTTGVVAGNQIPASGAVAVTGLDLLNGAGNVGIDAAIYGSDGVAVPGRLTFTASGATYAFTRTTAGTATNVPNPAVIEVCSGIDGTPIGALRAAVQVILLGRNDVGKVDYSLEQVQADLAAMIGTIDPRRFIIVGDINGTVDKMAADGGNSYLTTPASSRQRLEQVAAINAMYRAIYPGNFVDIMALLEAHQLTEPYTVDGRTFQVTQANVQADGLHPDDIDLGDDDVSGKLFMSTAIRDHLISKGY